MRIFGFVCFTSFLPLLKHYSHYTPPLLYSKLVTCKLCTLCLDQIAWYFCHSQRSSHLERPSYCHEFLVRRLATLQAWPWPVIDHILLHVVGDEGQEIVNNGYKSNIKKTCRKSYQKTLQHASTLGWRVVGYPKGHISVLWLWHTTRSRNVWAKSWAKKKLCKFEVWS